MNLVHIAPDSIVVDDTIGFREYGSKTNQDFVNALAQSIEARGLETPIGGYLDANGKHILVKGFRRLRAIQMIRAKSPTKFETVPFIVSDPPGTAKDALLDSIASNEQSTATPLELGLVVKRLVTEFQMTQKAVGTALGKSQPSVSKYVWLTDRAPAIQDALRAEVISARACYEYFGDKEADGKILALIGGKKIAADKTPRKTPTGPNAGTTQQDKGPSWQDMYETTWLANQDLMAEILPNEEGVKEYTAMTREKLVEIITRHVAAVTKLAKAYEDSLYPVYEEIEVPVAE